MGWLEVDDEKRPHGCMSFYSSAGKPRFLSVLPKTNSAMAGKEGTMKGQVGVMAVENQPGSVKRQLAISGGAVHVT